MSTATCACGSVIEWRHIPGGPSTAPGAWFGPDGLIHCTARFGIGHRAICHQPATQAA